MVTFLQELLGDRSALPADFVARVGCDRATVYRWQTGRAVPSVRYARRLVALLADRGLDFDGCYRPSVQVGEGAHG